MSEPKSPQKAPYVIEEKEGVKFWCACGLSANQPYCDGSHKVSDIKPLQITIQKSKSVAWCGCKHSAKKPFCDGTHTKL